MTMPKKIIFIGYSNEKPIKNVNNSNYIEEVFDLVQFPAYLCSQTIILKAAAKIKRPIHQKKPIYESLEYEKIC